MVDVIWRWDYVNNIIYDFFIRNCLEIIFLWIKSRMGDFKIYLNNRIFPSDSYRDVIRRIDSSGISIIDHFWNCGNVRDGSLM